MQFCLSRTTPATTNPACWTACRSRYLKLSQKFTAQSGSAEVRDADQSVLVDRAHLRGVEVIGHSIEDAQTAATLWMSGIDFIQGNLVQSANDHLEFGFDQSVL